MADRSTGRSGSSEESRGGIRRGGGLGGGTGRCFDDPPTVIATGCGGGSIGREEAEDGPATCEADAWIDATSWRCFSLFAEESRRTQKRQTKRGGGDREMGGGARNRRSQFEEMRFGRTKRA